MFKVFSRATLMALVAGGFGIAAWTATAQAQAPRPAPVGNPAPANPTQQRNPPPIGLRVIDLKALFDKHQRFQQATNLLKSEVAAREDQLKGLRDRMQKDAELLKTFQSGSNEYKQLEANLIRADGELKAQLNIGRKEFLEKEAKIYWDVYREVLDELAYYSQVQGVSVILRYSRDTIDSSDNPQEVLKELNKSVVYHHPSIDITDMIVDELNRRAQQSKPLPPGNPGVSGRPAAPTTPPRR